MRYRAAVLAASCVLIGRAASGADPSGTLTPEEAFVAERNAALDRATQEIVSRLAARITSEPDVAGLESQLSSFRVAVGVLAGEFESGRMRVQSERTYRWVLESGVALKRRAEALGVPVPWTTAANYEVLLSSLISFYDGSPQDLQSFEPSP